MPRDPGEVYQPSVEIDDERKWRLRLSEVVEVESPHKDRRKDAVFLSWHFTVHDLDTGVAVSDDNTGEVYVLWHATNDATYFDKKANKIGGAREMAHVLLNREISDEEVRAFGGIAGWSEALEGKTAVADVEWGVDKKGYNRLNILRLRPEPQQKSRPAAPPPEPEPEPSAHTNGAAETPSERKARLLKELADIDA